MTDPYYNRQRKHTRMELTIKQQSSPIISRTSNNGLLLEENSVVVNASRRTVSSLALPAADDFLKEQCWRRFGKARRVELLERDHLEFRINPSCTVQKYFSLAERVS